MKAAQMLRRFPGRRLSTDSPLARHRTSGRIPFDCSSEDFPSQADSVIATDRVALASSQLREPPGTISGREIVRQSALLVHLWKTQFAYGELSLSCPKRLGCFCDCLQAKHAWRISGCARLLFS